MTEELYLIAGEAGHGKSTTSEWFVQNDLKEESFAGPLKRFAIDIGFEHHQVYGTQEQKEEINAEWNISFRTFAQGFGTGMMRDLLKTVIPQMNLNNRNFWARVMEIKMKKHKKLVISDGRFPDEAQLVLDYAGRIIKVKTTRDLGKQKCTGEYAKHSSETSINQIKPHFIIMNDGTIEDLHKMVRDIYNQPHTPSIDEPVIYTKDTLIDDCEENKVENKVEDKQIGDKTTQEPSKLIPSISDRCVKKQELDVHTPMATYLKEIAIWGIAIVGGLLIANYCA
jgi:hypothetical protein